MSQSRRHSLAEATANTILGIIISWTFTYLVFQTTPLFALGITLSYAGLSWIRSYLLRGYSTAFNGGILFRWGRWGEPHRCLARSTCADSTEQESTPPDGVGRSRACGEDEVTLPLTPEIMEAAYEFLRFTPPFKNWRLPPGDDVVFHVSADMIIGYYTRDHNHHIALSSKRIGTTALVMHIMAHEMIHLHQALRKTETRNTEHNAEFDRLAKRVATIHGWDFKEFYR
jgi:SprT-like family.